MPGTYRPDNKRGIHTKSRRRKSINNQKQQNNVVAGLCEGITASKGTPCGKPSKFVTESGKRACGFHKNKI